MTHIMKRKLFVLFLALLCLNAAPSYSSVRTEKDTFFIDDAQGHAVIRSGNTKTARDEARRMAYRDAVSKAAEACVSGLSAKVRTKVADKSPSLVKNFKITSETISGDTLTLTASCTVSAKSLDGVLGSEVISMLGNPRVMILVDEQVGGKAPFISTVETELLRQFEKAGYLIVDKEQAETLLALDPKKAFNDPAMLTAAAKTLRADIIVVARATGGVTARAQRFGIKMVKIGGSVQVKAVLTKTAYQITSTTYHGGSGSNWVAPNSGVGGIFKSGAARAAEEIIYKIAYKMASTSPGPDSLITVNVRVAGVSFKDVETIEERLREFAGDGGNIFERMYENDTVEIDVVSAKTARNLASFLSDYAEIKGVTAQTVTAQMGNVPPPPPPAQVVINVYIDNVKNDSDAHEIEKALQELAGTAGKVSISYSNPALNITITYSKNPGDSQDSDAIVKTLKGMDIRIDDASASSIKGWKGSIWW